MHGSDISNSSRTLLVVGTRQLEAQTKESARSADKRPSPGYCVAICFYYAALGHMFVLAGCARGAGPYVSIGWLWAICFYCACVCVYVCVCMCICMCVYIYM